MNIVHIYIYDYDGNIVNDYLFHTNKPGEFFCTLDHDITDEFRDFLKKNYQIIYDQMINHGIGVFYYYEDSINKI